MTPCWALRAACVRGACERQLVLERVSDVAGRGGGGDAFEWQLVLDYVSDAAGRGGGGDACCEWQLVLECNV